MKHPLIVLALLAVAGTALARTSTAPAPAAPGADPAAASADAPQHSKMKACNADARTRGLHGDERRAFMKQCLSGKAAKAPAN